MLLDKNHHKVSIKILECLKKCLKKCFLINPLSLLTILTLTRMLLLLIFSIIICKLLDPHFPDLLMKELDNIFFLDSNHSHVTKLRKSTTSLVGLVVSAPVE